MPRGRRPSAVLDKPETQNKPPGLKSKGMDRVREDYYETRTTVKDAGIEALVANPDGHEQWWCASPNGEYLIFKERRMAGDVVGESYIRPQLTLRFHEHHFVLAKDDPEFDAVTYRLRERDDFGHRLKCMSDASREEQQKAIEDPTLYGVNLKTQFEETGVFTEGQKNKIKALMKSSESMELVKSRSESKKLRTRVDQLMQELKAKDKEE